MNEAHLLRHLFCRFCQGWVLSRWLADDKWSKIEEHVAPFLTKGYIVPTLFPKLLTSTTSLH